MKPQKQKPQKQKPRCNPVAKYAAKFNRAEVHRDRKKYKRKEKYYELYRTDYERTDRGI